MHQVRPEMCIRDRHQDIRYWSFSDTDLVSCWLALGDENWDNGGLSFIPGSHAAAFPPAQFDEKKFFRDDAPENAEWIARAVCPELRAGDLVFFLSLIHISFPNRRPTTAPAAPRP